MRLEDSTCSVLPRQISALICESIALLRQFATSKETVWVLDDLDNLLAIGVLLIGSQFLLVQPAEVIAPVAVFGSSLVELHLSLSLAAIREASHKEF